MSERITRRFDCATEGGPTHYECAKAKIADLLEDRAGLIEEAQRLVRERDAARADAQRFVWWFCTDDKSTFVLEYLYGMRGGWSLDQWRAAIDAAKGGAR